MEQPPAASASARTHVSALWVGKPLGPYERLCLTSFRDHGLDVDLYAYAAPPALPAGVRWRDAAEILPPAAVFENPRQPGTFAAFSNRFRYRLLQERDTTWTDADVLCLRDELPSSAYLFGFEADEYVNSAVLGAPRDSEFLDFLGSEADAMKPDQIQWGQMGPGLVTTAVQRFGLGGCVRAREDLYPIHYEDVWMLFDPRRRAYVEEMARQSYCLHWWNESVRRADPAILRMRPPDGSFMANAFREHAVTFPDGTASVDPVWVRTEWRRSCRSQRRFGAVLAQRFSDWARRLVWART